jgi:2-iminobutanoate/2-iminopropanoate deaminase
MVISATRSLRVLLAAVLAVAVVPAAAKECFAPDPLAQQRAFSRAVVTEGGRMLWLGGQTADATFDFERQTRSIFSDLDRTIRANGGAGLADMVTMTVFINDVRHGDRFTEIRKEVFRECFPASALITVTGFARPGVLIEVQGIAVVGSTR